MGEVSDYLFPDSIKSACDYLRKVENPRIIVGGTDLTIELREKHVTVCLISLSRIPSLKGIRVINKKRVFIGAGTPLSEIVNSEIIKDHFPALSQAAETIGSPSIRNTATIGGNVANASPSADMSPVLMIYGSRVKISDGIADRVQDLETFFVEPGKTTLGTDEIVTGFDIALPRGIQSGFLKTGKRKAMEIAIVNAAMSMRIEDNHFRMIKIALGSVAPTTVRAFRAEQFCQGKPVSNHTIAATLELIKNEIQPIDDIRASARYREHMAIVLCDRLFDSLIKSRRKA